MTSFTAGTAALNTELTRKAFRFTKLPRMEVLSLLTRKMSSYFEMDGGDLSVRTTFWRGVIAGGILGAAVSMMATGGIQRQGKKSILGYTARGRNRADRMMRRVSKTVNNMIK